MEMARSVDEFIIKNEQWQEELIHLRQLLVSSEMEETVKWGFPVYTVDGKNVVGLGSFKSYFGLWFNQGVFLKDKKKKLINANKAETAGMRQWRFNSFDEMDDDLIKAYIQEAIENQKAGKMIKPQKRELVIPEELQSALDEDSVLLEHFDSFTEYKKKEFCNHIASAKRAETRMSRLAKMKLLIMSGIGVNDKYRR